mmetsp:Transcript_86494/g.158293  ORF Transcript_86494/g.158293 Transcript_86494/m.158293 type:complete len:210 (+) Transcript_86494:1892-2521(+)
MITPVQRVTLARFQSPVPWTLLPQQAVAIEELGDVPSRCGQLGHVQLLVIVLTHLLSAFFFACQFRFLRTSFDTVVRPSQEPGVDGVLGERPSNTSSLPEESWVSGEAEVGRTPLLRSEKASTGVRGRSFLVKGAIPKHTAGLTWEALRMTLPSTATLSCCLYQHLPPSHGEHAALHAPGKTQLTAQLAATACPGFQMLPTPPRHVWMQ